MAIASKPNTATLSIWHRPHSWLTAPAIISIIFNVLILWGFLPTVRSLIDTYSSEVNRAAVVNIGVFGQLVLFGLPIVITVIGAILLLQKRKLGMFILLAGLGVYLGLNLSFPNLSIAHYQYLIGYWCFERPAHLYFPCWWAHHPTLYYFFLPSILAMISLASIGWLKVGRH